MTKNARRFERLWFDVCSRNTLIGCEEVLSGMTFDDFKRSLADDHPPQSCAPHLIALWRDQHGDWQAAHETVQELEDEDAAWVHAYLHRKEGDESNARYWYRRARKPFPSGQTLNQEWEHLARTMLESAD